MAATQATVKPIDDVPFSGLRPGAAQPFNTKSRQKSENIRDFIILHYHVTERDDSDFWRHCRTMDIPDSLKESLALWHENARAYHLCRELFLLDSWAMVWPRQRRYPRGYHHLAAMMPEQQLRDELARMRVDIGALVTGMPSHRDFLKADCPANMPG